MSYLETHFYRQCKCYTSRDKLKGVLHHGKDPRPKPFGSNQSPVTRARQDRSRGRCRALGRCFALLSGVRAGFAHDGRWGVRRLVLLAALLLELALLLGGRVLVLLVLGDEVVHVGLGLGELHLVHALAGVPVEEGLAAEHGGELL